MRVVKLNLGFTILYNVVGLDLAATGILPPALAAATQSLPDFGIVANSARVLRKAARTGQPPRGGSFSARTCTAKTPS
jgi:Cu+-exporting ATPase